MRPLSKRVAAMEAATIAQGPLRWIRLIVHEHETQAQVRAQYEAEHGPIADDVGIVFRVIVSPDE